jgi:hypothetical protein
MNYHHTLDGNVFPLQLKAGLSEFSPDHPLIEEYVERAYAKIPATFVPSARGIAVFSGFVLPLAHPEALLTGVARRPPHGWLGRVRDGDFRRHPSFACLYMVRQYGKLWGIERTLLRDDRVVHEVLSFAFGPTPLFHRKHRWAIALAHHCHPNVRDEAQFLRWVPIAT